MTKSTYLGKCMYCGQQAMLEINDDIADSFEDKPDDWDTYISEEVTKICKCEGARAWWNVERRVRKAEDECLKLAGNEQIGEMLKVAVRHVMKDKFDKLIIKDGGVTYSVYLDSDERIHVRREHKVTEDKTE
jgi:hypothetical protein